ncbi:hypothetical protein [Undibacterium sp. Ji22W]|uniref:hypothetical protein n=1 Tax=Undibacterium sp. Ji22W TaxID=3413038 RepID=UPI003BF0C99E
MAVGRSDADRSSTPHAECTQHARTQGISNGALGFLSEYLLICQAVPEDPMPRAELMSQLHAHIQDVFNEYNVQIMSPHYLCDPEREKIVPKDGWFRAPANAPSDEG